MRSLLWARRPQEIRLGKALRYIKDLGIRVQKWKSRFEEGFSLVAVISKVERAFLLQHVGWTA